MTGVRRSHNYFPICVYCAPLCNQSTRAHSVGFVLVIWHKLPLSREGGDRNEKKSQTWCSGIKAAETKPELPDLDRSKNAVVSSLRSPELKRGYRYAIVEFIEWYCSELRLSFSRVVVTSLTYEAIDAGLPRLVTPLIV